MLLDRHAGPVNRATYSPDGKRIVTSGSDHVARVWNASSGKQVKVLRDRNHTETSAAFSPDGGLLATVGGNVRIWRVSTWQAVDIRATQLGEAEGTLPYFGDAVFSPDGTQLATWAAAELSLWMVGTWERTVQLENPAEIADIAFSPDGTAVAAALKDKTARVWDLKVADTAAVLRSHTGTVSSVRYSPNGQLLVTAGSNDCAVRIWNVTTEQTLLVLAGDTSDIYTAVFSPNGEQILTASADGTAQLWELSTGESIAVLHSQDILSATFSPDGVRVITTGKDGAARIWSKRSLEVRRRHRRSRKMK
jgi:WD40 repeat protein